MGYSPSEPGLFVVDISNPANSTIVGSCSFISYALDVKVSGNYAYVTDRNSGLKVINVSDPSHPTQVGSYAISGNYYAVAISGNYAYLTDDSGLLVINVSNPANPTKAGGFAGVYARDIAISGNRLYTASGFTKGFQIFDISSPTSPVRLGVYDTPNEALGVAVKDNYAYVGDSGAGLRVINISNPASPSLVSTYDTIDSAGCVAMCGNMAFVADRKDGMLAIDISNPTSPTRIWGIRSGNVGGTAVSGSTVYAACSEDGWNTTYDLNTLDTSDPANIAQIGSCAIPSLGFVDLSSSFAWVSGGSKGLHIVDITAPSNPVNVGTFDTPGVARDVAFFDHYACVADGDYGIQIIDVTNPAGPTQVGTYNTTGYANAVSISGNCAFVADGNKGMQVVSLANPAVPTLIGSYQTAHDAYDIEISGHFAYLTTGYAGVQTFDIANPDAPVQIGGESYIPASGLMLCGNYLYTSGSMIGKELGAVFDVSDPANPVMVGRAPFGGEIAVSGNRVYTVSGDILKILEATQSDQCIIYGFVKNPLGEPVSGITITTTLGGYTATTDWKGRYELDYVDPQTYTITASGLGWASTSTTNFSI